ncbi:hypothetical protein DFH06DRAFT_1200834 [Mycena polygramma]|nr:hypothetical protein DFH06DRAFT_1200834 [Mycena polygramma]
MSLSLHTPPPLLVLLAAGEVGSPRMTPLPCETWAHTRHGSIVIASNTKKIPCIPCWDDSLLTAAMPRINGRWGFAEYSHVPQPYSAEFPYLAWLPVDCLERLGLPVEINRYQLTLDSPDFVRHLGWGHRGYLKTEVRETLQTDVVWYIEKVQALILTEEAEGGGIHRRFEARPPVIAMVRAHNACFSMRFPHLTYRDLLEYLAGLQRAIAELQAYIMWYDRMYYADFPTASQNGMNTGLRGSIATDTRTYASLRSLGAPVWLEVEGSLVGLDPAKESQMTDLLIEVTLWADTAATTALQDTRKGVLVHNKPLEYYPPHVLDLESFETAARGYGLRTDTYNKDKYSLADVRRMIENEKLSGKNHNISATLAVNVRCAGSLAMDMMERYASDRAILPGPDEFTPGKPKVATKSSKWARQYQDIIKAYSDCVWAPRFVEAWELALNNTTGYPSVHNVLLTPKCKDLLLFVAPPPHLFLNKAGEKTATMFFVWICIRRAWLSRMDRDVDCSSAVSWGMTTQQWREVLNGLYWKCRHPREGPSAFENRRFWTYGGPLIFGEDEEDWASVELSPLNTGSATGRVELSDFSDDRIKSLLIWDLTLCHAQLQLNRADEILYASKLRSDPMALNIRRVRRSGLFCESLWDIPEKVAPWERDLEDHRRRHWLSRFVEIVREWPCAAQVEWVLADQKLSEVMPVGEETQLTIFCRLLPEGKVQTLERSAVAVYYQGVFDALGILATAVVKKPEHTAAMQLFFSI